MPQTKPFHSCQKDFFDIFETSTSGRKHSILIYSDDVYFWLKVKIYLTSE